MLPRIETVSRVLEQTMPSDASARLTLPLPAQRGEGRGEGSELFNRQTSSSDVLKVYGFTTPVYASSPRPSPPVGEEREKYSPRLSCITLLALTIALGSLTLSTAFAQEAADNVVIVLDASGSMSGQLPGAGKDKMSAAKAALKEVLKSVPQDTHIGLLVFSARGANSNWFYPLGPRDDAKLTQAIDRPMPGGNTPLGKYIKIGADRLLEERAKQFGYGTFRLLIVTDGEAEDKDLVDRYTPEIVARGITVDAIGVAMNQRHTLATKVHSYRSANDAASLKRALAEVFGEIGGRGKDSYNGDAFAELQSIPTEAAQAMIQALSSSGNQPIGEKPKPKAAAESVTPTANAVSAPPSSQSSAPTVTRRGSGFRIIVPIFGGISCSGIFFVLLILVIIRSIRKSRR